MDKQILRAIVKSREEVTNDPKYNESFEKSLNNDKFPTTERNVLTALTRSFTDLLSYKVSPEALQRYSVRIQVIEILRDWIRPPREIESWKTFSQVERVLEFVERILRIYLTNDILRRDDKRVDILVTIANALIALSVRNKKFLVHAKRLLNGIAVLHPTEDSRRLLLTAVEEKDLLDLDSATIDQLYAAQSRELIEEPLVNSFIDNLRDTENIAASGSFETSCDLDKLLNVAAVSPAIFQIASSVLKEIFVNSNYSPKVSHYISFFLDSLRSRCRETNKNIFDLYPLHLQSLVILLDIHPERHSANSRIYALNCLEKTHQLSPDEALTLVSHFPKWSQLFSDHLADYSELNDSFSSTTASMDY